MIGKEILGYRVDEKIGSGGFGTVYKVSKTNAAGTYVRALKHITLPTKKQYASVLNSMGGDYAKADNYFVGVLNDIVSEIRILSTLSESGTQNIVRYYENDIIETQSPKTYDIYILMEYLTPFPDYFDNRSFTVKDVIRLGKDILTALISCHGKNIIHRDIKDDNIFVSPDGVYKLGDFGVSKALKDKSRAESVKGTPNFIAPEVYLGKEKYDNTVDIYSLGIVLYKLLNKSRNPFLPAFPAPYSTDDEDAAFEARMSGKIPELPVGAQNELGQAIIKAIMPREQRYNSANEFLAELQHAEQNLSETDLAEVVNVVIPTERNPQNTAPSINARNNHFDETVGGDGFSHMDETIAPATDKHLFETFASPSVPPAVAPETLRNTNNSYTTPSGAPRTNTSDSYRATSYGDVVDSSAPPRVAAVTKKDFKWLIYLSPVIIAAVYIIMYVFVLPNFVFNTSVGLIEWLFANPDKILDAIKEPSTFLNPIYLIIGIKIMGWLLVGGFITSLFFVGHTIQNQKPKISLDAKLVGNEAYVMALDLFEQIKGVTNQDVTRAQKAMKSVCERLKNESDFGSGSSATINCENEIAACLKAIEGNIVGLYNENTLEGTTNNIEMMCQKILSKLKVRIELKKK